MFKRDVIEGPSCLTAAADDEPIFVLRANDELASTVVRLWAGSYFDTKIRPTDTPNDELVRRIRKYHEANELADAMDEWRRQRQKKRGLPVDVVA
jgi:hypothetical protein